MTGTGVGASVDQHAARLDPAVQVVLAEDMHMVRAGFVALLQMESDIEVVAAVASGYELVEVMSRCRPQVVILDVNLPDVDGIAMAARLRITHPETASLILTGFDRPGTLRRALEAGVSGFLLKEARPAELVQAVRAVAGGQRYIDGHFAAQALNRDCPVTKRELEVLESAANGLTTEEISITLFMARGTVRNHLATVVAKLHARNRIDAIRIAQDSGWL